MGRHGFCLDAVLLEGILNIEILNSIAPATIIGDSPVGFEARTYLCKALGEHGH